MKYFLSLIIPLLLLLICSCKEDECPVCDYKSDWEGEVHDIDGYVTFNATRDANEDSITLEFIVNRELLNGDLVKEGRMMVYVHHSYGDLAYDYGGTMVSMKKQAEFRTENVASERYFEELSLNGEPGWICTFTGDYSKNCTTSNNELPSFKITIKDINPLEGAKFNIWVDIDGPHMMDIQQRMLLII